MSQPSQHTSDADTPTMPPASAPPTSNDPPTVAPRSESDAAAAETVPAPGEPLDRLSIPGYSLLRVLGRGGMGVVYEARQEQLNRLVALKMILSGGHASDEDVIRFRTEAEAIARLQHPNIVQIYEIGEHQGLPYFSLEYCGGGSLASQWNGTPLPPQKAAQLVEVLARAMEAAHQAGVIHRDLKPANVLLTAAGPLKITDFGLAKRLDASGLTASGAIMGTPSYMAPEQADGRGRKIGPAADVYALGAILYEALTGRPPFKAATPLDTIIQVVANEPVPPSRLQSKVPRDLETICLKCLEKSADKRYSTAQDLAHDVGRYLRGEIIRARPVGTAERAWRWSQRNPALAGSLSAAASFLILGAAISVLLSVYAFSQADRADREARVAKENETVAIQNEELAKEAKILSDRRYYAAEMKLASIEAQSGQMRMVQQRLQGQEPAHLGEPDLRGFEWYYLRHLCHLDLRTFRGHTGAVQAVAYSPDGRRIASASNDGTVILQDAVSGRQLLIIRGDIGRRSCVAFSPDGARLVSAISGTAAGTRPGWASIGGTVKVWDGASGRHLLDFKGRGDYRRLVHSPDGRFLALVNQISPKVQVCDATSGQRVLSLRGHRAGVWDVAYSPDGSRIATASHDGTLKLWNAANGKELQTLEGHTGPVWGVAYSPDGNRLASASVDRTAKVWDTANGRELVTLRGHTGLLLAVAYSPDGRRLATASADETVKIWDSSRGNDLLTLKGHMGQVNSIAYSPEGSRLVSASDDHTVKIWDAVSSHELLALRGHSNQVSGLAYHPDGCRLASCGVDGTVRVWNTQSGLQLRELEGHSNWVYAVAYSPDGHRLALASRDNTVKVSDVGTGQDLFALRGHRGTVRGVTFSPNNRHLASASEDGTVRVWDTRTGQQFFILEGHKRTVISVAYSTDSHRLASASEDGTVRLWDAKSGMELLSRSWGDYEIRRVLNHPDGRLIAFGYGEQKVKAWDVGTGEVLLTFMGHGGWVNDVSYSPDGRRLVTGGEDGDVKLWDATTGQELMALKGHASGVYGVAFSPDGRQIASASLDRTVCIWDARDLTPQLLVQREARMLVNSLLARSLTKQDCLAAIRNEQTITEEARQQALEWVDR